MKAHALLGHLQAWQGQSPLADAAGAVSMASPPIAGFPWVDAENLDVVLWKVVAHSGAA